jgi:endoglucanase
VQAEARDFLDALLDAHGPSGHEDDAAAVFRSRTGRYARVTTDAVGNSYAAVGPEAGRPVLLLGHIDEIGLIVTHVEDDGEAAGLLRARALGEWDAQVLVGQHVEVRTASGALVPGVVGKPPIHLLQESDAARASMLADLWIDVGARDAADAAALVAIGDTAVIARRRTALANGRLASKALDNRAGAWVVAEAGRRIAAAGGGSVPVVACAPVLEETLMDGARAAAHTVAPAVTIVVDVTHATDVPGVDRGTAGLIRLGHGPVLTRGLGLHPGLHARLADVAAARGIAVQHEALHGVSSTATDVDGALDAHAGSAIALVSLPLRHMHSPSEVCALADLDGAAELVSALCLSLGADEDWSR